MAKGIEIDRCVCFDTSFSALKERLNGRVRTIEEIRAEFGCSSCCGICQPYIERMLATGETVIHEIIVARPS